MYEGGEQTVSEPWRKPLDMGTTASSTSDSDEHLCKLVLYKEIQDSGVRIWDIVILIPNLLFLLFIAMRFNRARLKLRATSSPIYLAFYGLVICNVIISVIRCVVSMTVNASADVGEKIDKVLWVTVRFFLLSTEMSVVIFGLAFGHLDSRSSIRRVLIATSTIALAFTITQGTLELVLPDDTFRIRSRYFYVFGHGGMMFWFCSSLAFTIIYIFILILPWTRLRDRLNLPTRKSFYAYIGTLATLNLVQFIGAGLLNYTQNPAGLCVVDLTTAIYLTFFTPLVYHTFLSEVFGVSQPSIMFSYKAQVDDTMEELTLPHQQSFSSLKTDSDYIYQVHTPSIHMPLYESLTAKPSVSTQRTSLYSLKSRKDPKASDTSHYSSQATLYVPSETKTMINQRNYRKSSPDLVSQIQAESASFVVGLQKKRDLSINNPILVDSDLKNSTSALNMQGANIVIPPFEKSQTPDVVDGSRSLAFKQTTQSDLDPLISPTNNTLPPLESSLQNILNNASSSDVSAKNLQLGRSLVSLDLELSNDTSKATSQIVGSEDDAGGSDVQSCDFVVNSTRGRNTKAKKSTGLGDYLQSLKSPKYQSPDETQREN